MFISSVTNAPQVDFVISNPPAYLFAWPTQPLGNSLYVSTDGTNYTALGSQTVIGDYPTNFWRNHSYSDTSITNQPVWFELR